MKFEIYGEEEKEEKVVKLRLMRNEYGLMCITAVDDDGNLLDDGIIASILSNGILRLSYVVNSELGFQLDQEGRIRVER